MRSRSRTDISASVLGSSIEPANKAELMYRSYLSYEQLSDYLALLCDNGLLSFDQITGRYQTTDKGRSFLEVYEKTREAANAVKDSSVRRNR